MRVMLSDSAKVDLAGIADHIAQDNPRRAHSFVKELLDKAYGLADMPHAFPLVRNYEQFGIRRRAHGSYLIFYRVGGDAVTIIHILHGARDYERLLRAE